MTCFVFVKPDLLLHEMCYTIKIRLSIKSCQSCLQHDLYLMYRLHGNRYDWRQWQQQSKRWLSFPLNVFVFNRTIDICPFEKKKQQKLRQCEHSFKKMTFRSEGEEVKFYIPSWERATPADQVLTWHERVHVTPPKTSHCCFHTSLYQYVGKRNHWELMVGRCLLWATFLITCYSLQK